MEKNTKMKFIKLQRTFKEGLTNFYRNGWLSFATVSVLAISLFIISFTFLLGVTANLVLHDMQNKINVSVYFNPDVQESDILDIKSKLVGYKEIKSIDYVSKDDALVQFKKLSGANTSIQQALDEIGGNPLLSSLVIKANDPSQYATIVNAIGSSSFAPQISRINYDDNRSAIERLTSIIKLVDRIGLTLGAVFVIIGILITFNAIRLTMYAHKQEFEIERLVGASNLYIKMPFMFEGVIYGMISALTVLVLLFISTRLLSPLAAAQLGDVSKGATNIGILTVYPYVHNIYDLFLGNFWRIFFMLLISGVGLGTISGLIAIRRYLKV
jgi:cell division transport system permease protein